MYVSERLFELGMKVPRDELSKCRLVTDAGEITIELGITNDSPSIDFKLTIIKFLVSDIHVLCLCTQAHLWLGDMAGTGVGVWQ